MSPPLPLFAAASARQPHDAREWLQRFGPYGSALLGLSAVLLIWFGASYFIHTEKLQTEHAARENAANLSRAFAEDIIRSIRAVDQTLLYVRDSYARDPQHFDISLWSRNSQFLSDFNFQVSIIGRDGIMIASNIPSSAPSVDLSDREHFRVHAERDTDELFISKPLVGRVSNKPSIQMTRRITMPDGSFGGVVVVSVDPEYLSQLYGSIDVGQKGVVALVGTDGIVRARGVQGPSGVGRSIADGKLIAAFAKSKDGFYTGKSHLDGTERLYAYRAVSGYPLIVTVGLALDEVFAVYDENRRADIAIAGVLTLWLLAVTGLIFSYQRNLARARDAAEAGTRARSEFLAMMSHELRTPMNGVVGMAELLLDTKLTDEQESCAKTLRESASHLLRIINDVLDFSKLEAHRIEIEKISFDLHACVRDTAALLAVPAKDKKIDLTVNVAADVPRHVTGDPARLRQILLNLIGNAVKFTKAGRIAVGVVRDGEPRPERVRLRFTVVDTGIGIPRAAIPLLFREFSQLDSSIARRFGGTGLGLAICKRLVGMMGGTISVESDVGRGTTFRFDLDYQPAPAALEDRRADELRPPLVPAAAAGRVRMLLVEDNKTNQLVAIKFIEGLGYKVNLANNGVEAVSACTSTKYDVVFMDVMMPEMDGLAATKAIRKLPRPYCEPHIIALTAIAQKDDKDICLDAGMDDYLMKPVTRKAIAEKLRRFFAAGSPAATAATPAPSIAPAALPPAADGVEAAPFDETIYAELADTLGRDGIRSVLELFLSDSEQRFSVVREAARNGDNDCVKREVHSMKSSAANFGFLRLSALAKALERDAPGLAWPALAARIDAVAREFSSVKEFARGRLLVPASAARPAQTHPGEAHAD